MCLFHSLLLLVGLFNFHHIKAESGHEKRSLFDYLCNNERSEKVLNNTLRTDFFRSIISGTLDPVAFGAFVINDVYYTSRGPDHFAIAAHKKEIDFEVKRFLLQLNKTYDSYNEATFKTWHIKGDEAKTFVIPTKTIKDYADFLGEVAKTKPAETTVVANAPCTVLWSRIGRHLEKVLKPGNPWTSAAMKMFPPNIPGESKFKAILDHIGEELVDWESAKAFFDRSMDFEYRSFRDVIDRR